MSAVGFQSSAPSLRNELGWSPAARARPEREADQPAAVARHEVDRVGGRHLRGNDEVALILAVVVVDEDEHPPVARLVDDRLGADQHFGIAALEQLFEPPQRIRSRVPFGRAQLAQRIGVEAGGAGESGTADLAGGDDGVEPLDQRGAHDSPISHFNVMKRGFGAALM